ncbi:two-component system KDP operon response regulator KdpE [Chitinophaga skermanii]|uniref:Two-component system KDP operon response regulator KdpE n=1 Tax=Chitinophaga skermanii TaxID=331697 RepID=A0A327QCL1_9BACT|nr:response regulator [Chitinophaga skermanii]RAJ01618.1 two-component system KDP operon response regulator KdpE [Chitinophaga skermanii]
MGTFILIIDDEPDICKLLQLSLAKQGYQVKYVHGLKEGLKCLEARPPDILFLDIHLPDGSGLEALPRIRKQHDSLVIITISAYDSGHEKQEALSNGASYFLPKPFNVNKLRDLLQGLHS